MSGDVPPRLKRHISRWQLTTERLDVASVPLFSRYCAANNGVVVSEIWGSLIGKVTHRHGTNGNNSGETSSEHTMNDDVFSDPLKYMIYIFERIGKFHAEFPERGLTTVMVNLQVLATTAEWHESNKPIMSQGGDTTQSVSGSSGQINGLACFDKGCMRHEGYEGRHVMTVISCVRERWERWRKIEPDERWAWIGLICKLGCSESIQESITPASCKRNDINATCCFLRTIQPWRRRCHSSKFWPGRISCLSGHIIHIISLLQSW